MFHDFYSLPVGLCILALSTRTKVHKRRKKKIEFQSICVNKGKTEPFIRIAYIQRHTQSILAVLQIHREWSACATIKFRIAEKSRKNVCLIFVIFFPQIFFRQIRSDVRHPSVFFTCNYENRCKEMNWNSPVATDCNTNPFNRMRTKNSFHLLFPKENIQAHWTFCLSFA